MANKLNTSHINKKNNQEVGLNYVHKQMLSGTGCELDVCRSLMFKEKKKKKKTNLDYCSHWSSLTLVVAVFAVVVASYKQSKKSRVLPAG